MSQNPCQFKQILTIDVEKLNSAMAASDTNYGRNLNTANVLRSVVCSKLSW